MGRPMTPSPMNPTVSVISMTLQKRQPVSAFVITVQRCVRCEGQTRAKMFSVLRFCMIWPRERIVKFAGRAPTGFIVNS